MAAMVIIIIAPSTPSAYPAPSSPAAAAVQRHANALTAAGPVTAPMGEDAAAAALLHILLCASV